MKHLGDITKIDGHKVPLVDIVTGGSPCQDLSVAGKRAGLDGERSGLFMEQIRIIKEMRDECRLRMRGADDNGRIIPRFMVWENVPGAFSSNKGQDFRAVLEETARIVDKDATIPMPEGGRWTPSGCIVGDGWSIAWRVHDAQFWGVPQRRKRIALVADFGGSSAPEILFERKGLSGNITESGEQGKRVTATSERNFDKAISFQERAGCEGGGTEPITASKAGFFLNARSNGKADTLVATDYKDPQMICYGLDRASFNQGQNAQYDFQVQKEIAQTIVAKGPGGVLTHK